MPAFSLQCPHCAGVLQIDSRYGGQQVACPHCHAAIVVPVENDLLQMLAAEPPPISPPPPVSPPLVAPTAAPQLATAVSCPVCAGVFQVRSSPAGQQVACPHCGTP